MTVIHIKKTITLDPLTETISKAASIELDTPESTLIRYFLYCFNREPNVTFAMVKQRLFEPSTRETYLSEMKATIYRFMEKQQPGVRVHSIVKRINHFAAPSGRRYSFGRTGIRVTNAEDIAFFKQQEAGSGFKVVDARVEVEAEVEE